MAKVKPMTTEKAIAWNLMNQRMKLSPSLRLHHLFAAAKLMNQQWRVMKMEGKTHRKMPHITFKANVGW